MTNGMWSRVAIRALVAGVLGGAICGPVTAAMAAFPWRAST